MTLSLLFVLLVSLGLNGWSLPHWHFWLDQSPETEVLLGKSRVSRGDDYVNELPLILSQLRHRPSFPVINRNLGTGLNNQVMMRVPALSPVMVLRPSVLGFFIGPDTGLAWCWWFLAIGIFYTTFLLLMVVTRNDFWLSFGLALSFLYSPFVQFWSMHKGEMMIHMTLCILLTLYLTRSRNTRDGAVLGILLGWSAVGCILDFIYPPYTVVLFYFSLVFLLAIRFSYRSPLADPRVFTQGILWAAVVFGGLAGWFYFANQSTILSIQNTIYPGRRILTGCDRPFWSFLSADFFPHLSKKNLRGVIDFKALENISESGSFFFFLPLIFLCCVTFWGRFRKLPHRSLYVCLLGYSAVLCIFMYIGFPKWLAQLTFFSKVPGNRTLVGLGFSNTVLMALWIQDFVGVFEKGRNRNTKDQGDKKRAAIASLIWLLILGGFAFRIRKELPLLGYAWPAGLFIQLVLLYFALWKPNRRAFLTVFVGTNIAVTCLFNPIVHGGTHYLYHNPISEKMQEVDRAEGGSSKWVVFGDLEVSGLPRILGIQSLGGYHTQPDTHLWQTIDPEGKFKDLYNISGYVVFEASSSKEVEITQPWVGVVAVHIHPEADVFSKLGVKYFLVRKGNQTALFSYLKRARLVLEHGNYEIYEI